MQVFSLFGGSVCSWLEKGFIIALSLMNFLTRLHDLWYEAHTYAKRKVE
jgi:hypothetical protein